MDLVEEKVSVIVPIYNMEKYLERCVDSLLKQTYKNLEIILVDDGSTDKSGNICDEYALKDQRVVVIHKKNGGLSSARNAALDVFTGEYITSVDPDDYVFENYVKIMYNALKSRSAKICFCDHRTDCVSREEVDKKEFKEESEEKEIISISPYKYRFDCASGHTQYWCYLYHKSLAIRENGEKIYFDVAHIRMEDVPYWAEVFSSLKKDDEILYVPNKLYVYRLENKPLMNTEKILATYIGHWEAVKSKVKDKKNLFRSLVPIYAVNYCSFLATFILQDKRKTAEFAKAREIVKKHYPRILFSRTKLKIKIKLATLTFFPKAYEKWRCGKQKL